MARILPVMRGVIAAVVLVTAASCTTVPRDDGSEAKLAKKLEGLVAEKPRSCIDLDQAVAAEVYRDTIVYSPSRRLRYVNHAPGCSASIIDPLFVVEPLSGRQLCRGDTVKLVDRMSHMPGGFCILGDFTPYRSPKR